MRRSLCHWLVALLLALALSGCVSAHRANSSEDDPTWTKLVQTAKQLQWSEADDGAAFAKAQKELGLEEYGAMDLGGTLFVAKGKRNEVHTRPWPKVWRAGNQMLICAGDLYGDGRTEYVLGCGWFGPMGGFIVIYDAALRKISEVKLDNVFALQLEDLLGDGGLEILCWEDHHNGTDGWLRYLAIFKPSKARGLTKVWEGATYSCSNAGGFDVTKHKLRIVRTRGKPAIIETKHIYSRGIHEDTEDGTSYSYLETPYTRTRYVWNPVSGKFEAPKEVE